MLVIGHLINGYMNKLCTPTTALRHNSPCKSPLLKVAGAMYQNDALNEVLSI